MEFVENIDRFLACRQEDKGEDKKMNEELLSSWQSSAKDFVDKAMVVAVVLDSVQKQNDTDTSQKYVGHKRTNKNVLQHMRQENQKEDNTDLAELGLQDFLELVKDVGDALFVNSGNFFKMATLFYYLDQKSKQTK